MINESNEKRKSEKISSSSLPILSKSEGPKLLSNGKQDVIDQRLYLYF